MKSFELRYAYTHLYFGLNAVEKIRNHLNSVERVTIATGKQSARVSGALKDVETILRDLEIEYEVFDKIKANPTVEIADDLAKVVWENGSDCIIAIGGGSVIDTAKVSSCIALSGGKAEEYLKGRKAKRYLPLLAINLTHGTGSEIDKFAVLTHEREKIGISIRYPDFSFDDPKYTLTLPKEQSIYTTIDAFFHAYEAVTAKTTNPFVETLVFECARIIGENLPKEQKLEEKYNLLYASMIAGIALDMSPAHIVHAIEHALSGINPKLAHGCGLALIGPRAIYWIHKHSENSAKILRCLVGRDVSSAEEAEKIFREFLNSIGFNERLSDYIGRDDFKDVEKIVFGPLKYLLNRIDFEFTREMLYDILERSL
ncbi:iron-containing alcohol dehydrogenase [Archaeoglobus profundus]|uniref:Iron-containing alcohol dehydrogenase n=1 Tax=Archaeoglobus profundus (strain DSM 5631 / JCM 9629 / NBRC 100127 / Av18) TaxID=572546 RepID=D2RGM1_ARCPA|nr:iron-containing alcohol dehydrogenase [Archaeoglobus profundus]ADB57446.1 iron-containing alcohol dehydrogenase [Archaeoglobus profundus DSM 5631]